MDFRSVWEKEKKFTKNIWNILKHERIYANRKKSGFIQNTHNIFVHSRTLFPSNEARNAAEAGKKITAMDSIQCFVDNAIGIAYFMA